MWIRLNIKLFPIVLALLFFGCDDLSSLDSSSTTYNLISVFEYDDSDCTENEYDATEFFLNGIGGTFQITINNDGTAIMTTSYYCNANFFEEGYDNQEDCEANNADWFGGDYEGTWEAGDTDYILFIDADNEVNGSPFTISETIMIMMSVNPNGTNCHIYILEAE